MSRDEHFSCLIERDQDGRIERVSLSVDHGYGDVEEVTVNGGKADLVAATLHDIIRAAGVTGRQWSTPKPLELDQGAGSQVWLLLTAIKPLRRTDRIDEVGAGVAAMSREEAAYWFSKAHQPRGLRAIRLLLSDDTRRR
jgi:hypothetical protein